MVLLYCLNIVVSIEDSENERILYFDKSECNINYIEIEVFVEIVNASVKLHFECCKRNMKLNVFPYHYCSKLM